MENYIVINGKKAELTHEQLNALGIEVEKPSPFKRAPKNQNYYYISSHGRINVGTEYGDFQDDNCYKVANYCTDKALMQQRAYHEILNRLLWRYSMEHDGDKIDWRSVSCGKYFVYCDVRTDEWRVSEVIYMKEPGSIAFKTREAAQNAIKEIVKPFMATHPDFKF